MSRTKQAVAVAALLTGSAWAGTTWYAGYQAERVYQQAVQEINQASLGALHVQLTAFERGFLRSKANWELSYNSDPCQPDNTITVAGYDVIQQGIFPSLGWASIDSHIIWSDALQPAIKRVFADQPPITIHSKLSLLGALTVNMSSPAGIWRNQEWQLDWQKMALTAHFSADNKSSVDVQIPQLNLTSRVSNSKSISLRNISYHDQGRQLGEQPLLSVGETALGIGQVTLNYLGQQWVFKELSAEDERTVENHLLRTTGQYGIKHMMLNQKKLGDVSAQFVLDGISEQAATQVYGALARLQQQCKPPIKQTLQIWQPIMQSGFSFALDSLDLSLLGSTAQATAQLTMPAQQAVSSDPAQWFKQLDATAELILPNQFLQSMLQQANELKGEPISPAQAQANVSMLLEGYVQQGRLQKLKEGYRLKFQLQDGQAVLNGKPLS